MLRHTHVRVPSRIPWSLFVEALSVETMSIKTLSVGFLALALPAVLQAQSAAGTIDLPVTTETKVEIEVPEVDAAPGKLIAGYLGGEHGKCGGATRGFVRVENADGTTRWERAQQPVKGTCSDPSEDDLFAGFSDIVLGSVVSSTVTSATLLANGRVVATGNVRLGWLDTDGVSPRSARGAFVGLWEADGQLVHGRYFGRPGGNLPLPGVDCLMLCDDSDAKNEDLWAEAFGSQQVIADSSGITLVGWHRQPADGSPTPPAPRVWVHRLSDDLETQQWSTTETTSVYSEGLYAVVDDLGRTFVAARGQATVGRQDRDLILIRLEADGAISKQLVTSGAKDDEPTELSLTETGDLLLGGFFNDDITVSGMTFGYTGFGEHHFLALFDPDLALLGGTLLGSTSAVVDTPSERPALSEPTRPSPNLSQPWTADFGSSPARWMDPAVEGVPTPKTGDNHPAIPIAYHVVDGHPQRGDLSLLSASDNTYLRIVADDRDYLELRVQFDPDPLSRQALYLDRIRVELTTLWCYHAEILVKGMVSEEYVVAGERSLCPSAEPVLELQVPEDFSSDLGYDGSTYVDPNHRLVVALRIHFGEPDPKQVQGHDKNTQHASAEEDTSVDHVEVIVEY